MKTQNIETFTTIASGAWEYNKNLLAEKIQKSLNNKYKVKAFGYRRLLLI